jgi:DNA invertase Pin-like site-specific DNA recombinase
MPKCIIYTRISCKNNNSFYNSTSLDSQLETCRKFAKQNNFIISDEISEIKSAFNDRKKSQYSKMLRDIYRHKWGKSELKAIIVCDVSRFSRNLRQGLTDLYKLENKGITIYAVDQNCQWGPTYTTSKAQKIRFRNHLVQAEDESETKSLRQKRSYKYRKARGEYIGKAPYGFKTIRSKDNKRLITKNKQEQTTIKFISSKYNKGFTMNNIAYELNNKKMLRRGKEWTYSKVSYIINRDNKSFKNFKNIMGSLKNICENSDENMVCCIQDDYKLKKKRKSNEQNKDRSERLKNRDNKKKKTSKNRKSSRNKKKKNIII